MRRILSCHASSRNADVAHIVARALERSFTRTQVAPISVLSEKQASNTRSVIIKLEAESLDAPQMLEKPRGKLLVLGDDSSDILSLCGLRVDHPPRPLSGLDDAKFCFNDYASLSSGQVYYTEHPLAKSSPLPQRHFLRYDYAEWNNLGYGGISTIPDSAFGVVGNVAPDGAVVLAEMCQSTADGKCGLGPYMTLLDTPEASILWCARPVGPVDSVEWQVVERFFSDWRAKELPCVPVLCQTPAGCSSLGTMRLDCDEDIASARDLFEMYADQGIPLSLAVKTSLDISSADRSLLADVVKAGGTIMSHSHTHPQSWGANFDEAFKEATDSRCLLAKLVSREAPVDFAVSPFHTNPAYAVQALEKAGYKGFVGGIAANDPEYMLGRAGVPPFVDNIVTISQQSMLHGDSYRNQGHNVAVHKEAFDMQHRARGIFGYLDHPFSNRYQYGWDSAEQRRNAHQELIDHIAATPDAWFKSQKWCFDFLKDLSMLCLQAGDDGRVVAQNIPSRPEKIQYRLHGEFFTIY